MSNMQDDQYVANLLKFFNTCLECICKMSVGKTKHLVVKSFADTMGGYLNSYVGPITKVAFYAGNIKYCNVKRIFELIAELKDFLYTNGAGWAKPVEVEMFINVTAIVAPAKDASACDKLILDPASKNLSLREFKFTLLLRMRVDSRRNRQAASFVFLPYFDNDLEPNSIALPFKDNNLWSLFDEESVAILSKYYETCLQCILSREDHKRTLADFKGDFRDWLQQVVYPRLSDEKWYPAFGGVLKIIASLRDDENRITTGKKHASKPTDDSLSTWQLILITVSTAALVWLLVGLTLACFKYRQRHSCDAPSPCESPSSK
ncbi:uncharacterized protein LOC106640229 [Copidosoma floridanum]|uniref:uncharacterized protein LOC106640229 n=1 Tax=Copidosoma floridanum TaxID=29053 RepID=UPI0006C96ACE|nr:uncharacterized protein LOC106640229 [Copidosoma floridanum]